MVSEHYGVQTALILPHFSVFEGLENNERTDRWIYTIGLQGSLFRRTKNRVCCLRKERLTIWDNCEKNEITNQ